ncbi:hypothetical protein OAF64_02780 [Crocinitomicaceae bacterium]|jgi:hypothetical protein|nr:hypothetical protein [Crocinitomicaceae bacterium]
MKKVFLMLVLGAFITSCGPSLCDCRNLNKKEKKEQGITDKCSELKDDYKEEYKEADEDKKKAMREELDACDEKDND